MNLQNIFICKLLILILSKMLELEMDKLSIRQKIFEVKFAIDQEEALFYAQVLLIYSF